jgi:hypothetical protein
VAHLALTQGADGEIRPLFGPSLQQQVREGNFEKSRRRITGAENTGTAARSPNIAATIITV